jgi:peptide/nickel transport system substrate-binding protein
MGVTGEPVLHKELPIPARDVTKAKALLAEAGAPNPVISLMASNNPENLQAAQVIQAMATESGFDIQIQATEFASSLQLSAKGDFEAFLLGWSGRSDPDGNIYNLLVCSGQLNDGRYCNPEVDRELDTARAVEARVERIAHYPKVAGLVLQDRPIIYLYHGKFRYAATAKLSGFTPYPDGLIRPQGLRLE